MGLYLCGSRSAYDANATIPAVESIPPNTAPPPDPSNYKIKRHLEIEKNLLIEIQYMDCINYEGNKILLYKDTSLEILKAQVVIDPHFSENTDYKSPAARFEPTDEGWKMRVACLHCEFWFN